MKCINKSILSILSVVIILLLFSCGGHEHTEEDGHNHGNETAQHTNDDGHNHGSEETHGEGDGHGHGAEHEEGEIHFL